MAHTVVMQVILPDGGGTDLSRQMLEEIVVPTAKAQPGFQGGIWMRDGEKGMGVVVFDTAEHAEAAKDVLKPPPGGPQLVSMTVCEVGAQV